MTDKDLAFGLNEIALHVQGWLDWQAKERTDLELETTAGTHVVAIPAPTYPTRGQLEKWVETFRAAAEMLDAAENILSAVDA